MMNKYNADMIRLGLFVIVGTLLFIVGVYYVGNSKNIFGRNINLYADFKDVKGLQLGNNVRFMGINVGSVGSIVIENDTTIRVGMRVSKSIQRNVKKDAVASIGTNGLVGASLINITPGLNKLSSVEDGDVLISNQGTATSAVMETLSTTNETISKLSFNLLKISEKINSGEGLLASLINDPYLTQSAKSSLSNIDRSSRNLDQLSTDIALMIEELNDDSGLFHYLFKDTAVVLNIEGMMSSMDSLINFEIEPAFVELSEGIDNFNSVTEDLKAISHDLSEGEGTMGLLLKDKETELRVKNIIQNLDSSSAKLDENLLAMRRNWLFKKYFKEKEKTKSN